MNGHDDVINLYEQLDKLNKEMLELSSDLMNILKRKEVNLINLSIQLEDGTIRLDDAREEVQTLLDYDQLYYIKMCKFFTLKNISNLIKTKLEELKDEDIYQSGSNTNENH